MNLKQTIVNDFPQTPTGVEVFLFGSILTSENNSDIDLAIVYDKRMIGLKEVVELRQFLRGHIESISDFPSEIMLLSKEENEEMEFIQNTRTEKIK